MWKRSTLRVWMTVGVQCAVLAGAAGARDLGAARGIGSTAEIGTLGDVHLSVRRPGRVHAEPRLVVEGGAPGAWAGFVVRREGDEGGALAPAWLDTIGAGSLVGRVAAWRPFDVDGRAELELTRAALESGATVQALVLARDGTRTLARVSDSVTLVPLDGPLAAGGPRVYVTEFMKDPTAVGDTSGEWIELHNPGPGPIDITGWVLSDLGSESTVLANGGQRVVVPHGRHVVLGRTTDLTANGGVPVDYVYSSFSMSNGDDEIQLTRPDGTLADLVVYDDGVLWPDLPGRSASLDPLFYDDVANDDPLNWCHSRKRIVHGGVDSGTPGKRNEDCP